MKTLLRQMIFATGLVGCLVAWTDAAAEPRVYRDSIDPQWIGSAGDFWYRVDLPEGRQEFIHVDATAGSRRPALNHEAVARQITELTGSEVEAGRLPVEMLRYSDDGRYIDLLGGTAGWRLDRTSGDLTSFDESAGRTGLPFSLVPRLSKSTGAETHVTFFNRLDFPVTVWWVDGSGGRHKYADLAPGQRHRQHTFGQHIWLVLDSGGEVLAVFEATDEEALAIIDGGEPDYVPPTAPPVEILGAAVPSPDGLKAIFIRDHNLWLRDLETGTETALSMDGRANDSYRKDGQRPRLVEMEYEFPAPADSVPDVHWSPDSRYVIALRTRAVTERKVQMIASAPDDQLQPRVESYPYLKPGDDLPVGIPHLFDTDAGIQIPLDTTMFEDPWSIDNFHWTPAGDEFFFLYNQRGHQLLRLIRIKASSGKTKVIVEEKSDTFIDYQGKLFIEHLDAVNDLIWMSERDGWNHLYLYDRQRGRMKKQITEGNWVVREVDRVDAETGHIWLKAMGLVKGEDPYFIHYARVDFDGENFTRLTDGPGTHRVEMSPDGRFLVDEWSRVDLPPIHVLRDATDGRLVCELEQADASEIPAAGRRFPEPLVAPGRDGVTPIHGIIHRPSNFDPDRKYPVLEQIYAGPHGHHVPKDFRAQYRLQDLADRGFIIVQIDGMGTNWRHKAFHDVCWQNLVDGGFPDRIPWLKAAAAHEPALDLTRVGIYGGSAGGQNALAGMLTHGDFYKVAMADCGCHDNRMDKIWWNEQWMGYPIGPHYEANSNVTMAGNLEGSLLLIVGELDRNVDPASTMQVVDALIKADKDFEMLVIPGAGHGAAGTPYGRRRTADFFVRELLGAEPGMETREAQ
jgi:dipeptidyl aminopeptidase/acylaminoacyl peptidase